MIALKFLMSETCKLEIKSHELDLSLMLNTFGRSLSIILRASPKFDWVTSINISIKKYINFWVEIYEPDLKII